MFAFGPAGGGDGFRAEEHRQEPGDGEEHRSQAHGLALGGVEVHEGIDGTAGRRLPRGDQDEQVGEEGDGGEADAGQAGDAGERPR